MKKPEEYADEYYESPADKGHEFLIEIIARVQADAVEACIAAIPRNGVTAKEAYISTDIERAIRALLPEVTDEK